MQGKVVPDYPLLYSLGGFRYCDLLLDAPERAAWNLTLHSSIPNLSSMSESCRAVAHRAAQTLKWAKQNNACLIDIALNQLIVGRVALYQAILDRSSLDSCHVYIQHAVEALRHARRIDHIPLGLLTRSWLRFRDDARIGPESAQSDLDEAWEIAERGPMPLFLADIHLHRARLLHALKPYPWESPQRDLAEAKRLIEKHGYLRRMEELEDAEVTAKAW